ncbi:Caffeate O-methyltransferase (COMT) family [Cynara cardunculus var. scolymus]|uniref:Caffeate O-methyltransferase (COMT) family n=1 Tax=Cynara cardunculus var. scolymus TaxID=59895 RepID=A0A103XP48_CYNCS|nr:Caffeate O-methyltransferase (COMT) family [Cynara cardunculus var. scolymus]
MGSSEEVHKMSNEEEGLQKVMQINSGIVLPMLIKTAIELDLFEIMAKTPGARFSSSDLASNLPSQTPQTRPLLERILRFLATQSILESTLATDEHGNSINLYSMTPVSNHFVRNEDGTSVGIPFDKAHGVNAFEYPAKDNRFNQVFNKAMYDNTRIVMKLILEKYKGFEGAKELVDVGGGLGATLQLIVAKYPTIKGINFDLPHVIKDATPSQGVEHVGGDMFESVPKGDVIFMKWILHDWGDDYCIKLLKNCWAALPEYGKVVVVEVIMPDPEHQPISANDSASSQAAVGSDMIMLIANPGGKERTKKEFDVLAKEAGFTSTKIISGVWSMWEEICSKVFLKEMLSSRSVAKYGQVVVVEVIMPSPEHQPISDTDFASSQAASLAMNAKQEECKMSIEEEELLRVTQMVGATVLPMVIKTAIELDLFEIMAKVTRDCGGSGGGGGGGGGQFTSSDIASHLPTRNPETPIIIERILRYFVTKSILTCEIHTSENGEIQKLYGMAPICKYFVMVEGGIPFNKAHGENIFEYQAKNKRFGEIFDKAMYGNTAILMKMVLEKYDGFEGVEEVVDVGGGLGVEHVGGDMFQSVPKGDVIFMKWILHDWGDEYCIKLLKNCWKALPENGKVVVLESIVPEEKAGKSDVTSNIDGDMVMLAINPGGKERTAREYEALATQSGFAASKIETESGLASTSALGLKQKSSPSASTSMADCRERRLWTP